MSEIRDYLLCVCRYVQKRAVSVCASATVRPEGLATAVSNLINSKGRERGIREMSRQPDRLIWRTLCYLGEAGKKVDGNNLIYVASG
jgi:hypothetical protein